MIPLLAALLASSACAAAQGEETAPLSADVACAPTGGDWRTVATDEDRARLRDWREAWEQALEQARIEHGAEIAAEGALLEPDAALSQPLPPAGDYACRTIKVGTPPPHDLLSYVAYPAFRCRIRVEGDRILLTKLTGSQRPIGRLYTDNSLRYVFLGTMQLGDETRAYAYDL